VSAPVLVIVGPSASGKSALAVELAERLGGEIISADSVQIYRRFDIGSAKPTAAERARVPHHLIDELDALDPADAARFVQLADARLADIQSRGKRPIVCGGTFLWVKAWMYGLAQAPPADAGIRARHRELAERFGRPHLHALLEPIDPESHARLGPNDLVRVSRALEVHELTGKPLSQVQAAHGFRAPRHDVRLLGIAHARPALHERITARVRQMFEAGWLAEVEGLLADGYGESRALRSVGYRQVSEALLASTRPEPEQLLERVVVATRSFIRHQLTWLREQPVEWLEPAQLGELCARIVREARAELEAAPAR
jgi:tRNA dimethylallyltransferase